MTEKQHTNKQLRHQSAKSKYQHYHRVLSCKNLMKNVAPINPSPGQFLVQNNKNLQLPKLNQSRSYSILLTKNIKSIVQKSNPVPFGEMLNQVVIKKSLKVSANRNPLKKEIQKSNRDKNETQPYFRRPISAKIYQQTEGKQIQDSQILKHAIEYDRQTRKKQESLRKNYFQVKPKLKIPKHIHGYNTIILKDRNQDYNKFSQLNLQNEMQSKLGQINEQYEKSFLPTQYYLNQLISPSQLIQKYKGQNGIVFGFSRWFHTDGTHSWKRCRILRYISEEERWEIEWLCSGITKKVSRNNLYFESQNFQQFQKAVQTAEQFKKKSEIYMKYNILINLINNPTPDLSLQSQNKIISLINIIICQNQPKNKNLIQYRNQLIQEVKKLYSRSCHQFQFNLMLPYSVNLKKIFGGVLPDQMFNSNPRKMMACSSKQLQKQKKINCNQLFTSGLKKLKQKSFLNSEKKIKILQLINIINQQLSNINLLKNYKKLQSKTYTIKQLDTIISRNICEYFYKINCRICDIQHHVSKELDPLYANKKLIPEEVYNNTITRYHKFLLLVNMKIQACLRESLVGILKKIIGALPSFQHCNMEIKQNQWINWGVIYLQEKLDLKIELTTIIKQSKLEITPNQRQLSAVIMKNVQQVLSQIKNIKCVSKSYLPQVRPDNILKVMDINIEDITKNQEITHINETLSVLKQKLNIIQTNLLKFTGCLSTNIEQIFKNNVQIHKKFQKKNSYSQIQEIIQKINDSQKEIVKLIKIQSFDLCGIFSVNFQEIKTKTSAKISQTMKQVVNILIDKIHKDNEKMDKNVGTMLENMQKVPSTITQFVQLQKYVNQDVKQQIQKAHYKAKMLTQKMNLLQKTSQIIQYRQFQSCCQIYLKPLKLKRFRQDTLYKLENVYKKNFAEQLMKDSYTVLDNIKNCQRLFSQSLNYYTLQSMDKNFNIFSQLHEQIQSSCQRMLNINQKQNLLKWSKTNFTRLLQVKQQFQPYYKLITLHKNYRMKLVPLLEETFTQINYHSINSNITSSFETLRYLQNNKFHENLTYQPIIQTIIKQYQEFSRNLPLIKSLRNPDLRDRHWVIIENLTGVHHIRNEQITLKEVIFNENIRNQQAQLHKISQIATKQLIYQKSLNQLKRQWKDVRVSVKETKIGNESFKFINNITEIQKKLQNDILQINNILSSSFIKFLEADVSNWKSSVLQKIYQFVNYWPAFQNKVIFYLRLINSQRIPQIFQNTDTLQTQKNFQKLWKQFMANIQFQSIIVDIVNIRTWESMNNLSSQIDQIQKIISEYLQQKKKANSKLRLFSDDALTSMMVESNSEVALSSIKKCFNGVKSLKILEQPSQLGHQNIEILSTLDQKIVLIIQQGNKSIQKCNTNKNLQVNHLSSRQLTNKATYQFDELLITIDRQLKKQIKSTFLNSLKKQISQNDLLCQVQLLRTRLIFKNMLQKNMKQSPTLDGYELQLISEQRQNVQKMKKSKNNKKIRISSLHVIQSINQLNIVKKLNALQNPITSFQWFKYPKYELADYGTHLGPTNNPSSSKLKLIIGNNSRQYQFELIQCQNFIINPLNDSIFLSLFTSITDRMLALMQGGPGSSRVITFSYLGQLMGRNVTQISCSNLTSPSNLLQYLKIASSGLILVLQQLQRLSKQCISVFDQYISIFWMNYQLSRNNISTFRINSEQLILDIPNFALFGLTTSTSFPKFNNMSSLRQCFRVLSVYPIQFKYLLKCALLSVGFALSDDTDISFVECVIEQLNFHRIQGSFINVNKNVFIWQLARKFQQLYQQTTKNQQKISQILHESVQKVVYAYIPQQNHRIWKDMYELKLMKKKKGKAFTKINIEQDSQSQIKSQIKQKFQLTEQYKTNIQTLKTLLNYHCGIVITGSKISGKSTLINNLINQNTQKKKYNISAVNPLAYTIEQLYQGDTQVKGIIRQLVQELKLKATAIELNSQVINALYFDSGVGYWAEPLLQIVNKPQVSKISCPDGSLVTLPSPIKIIFQAKSLQDMSPNNFHSLGLLCITQQVTWKRLFCFLFEKCFVKGFQNSANAQFIQQLFQQSFDSVLDFYQSVFKQKTHKNSKFLIASKPAILKSLLHFFSVIYHKEDIQTINQLSQHQTQVQKQHQQKIKSQIFNIYIYSVVATLGLLIPDQSRKTFSRHFKYVLQQTHLCRYGWKKSNILNTQQQNIYESYYEQGQWKRCRKQKSLYIQNIILLDHYKFLQRVLSHHTENGTPCFIVGQQCSSKSFIFKNLINNLPAQKYTKNYFVCSTLTNKSGISNKISQMIQTQKYSRKINGFSNCKKNIIFIQDMNMTLLHPEKQSNGSIVQFIRQFYRKKSCYIQNNQYGFCNLQFYGTLNKNLPIPTKIYRFINPILINNPQNRVQSILQSQIRSSPIQTFEKELIIRCTLNLKDVIIRDLSQQTSIKGVNQFINLKDMGKIVSGVCRLTQNIHDSSQITLHTLLRYWVYLSDRVYSQKIPQKKKQFLFYLINNVLMQEQRVRYRTICPSSDFYIINKPLQNNTIQNKNIYQTYTLQKLSQKIKKMAQDNINRYRYSSNTQLSPKTQNIIKYNNMSIFIDENCDQILKLMVRVMNSFDFQSKIIIISNQQCRRIRSILQLVANVNKSLIFQTQKYNISSPIYPQQEIKTQKKLNQQFTRTYLSVYDNTIPAAQPHSRNCSPFQSQFQTKKIIQNQCTQKTSHAISQKKNKVTIHLSNQKQQQLQQLLLQTSHRGYKNCSNFILEDLLAFIKLDRYPRWLIPKQDIYEDIPQYSDRSIFTKKSTGLCRYLLNKQAHQIIKQQYQKEYLSKNIDINIILHYKKLPSYLTTYYKNLIGQVSVLFLNSTQLQPAQLSKTNKIIMTDVRYQDQIDEQFDQGMELKLCSGKNIGRMISKFGNKVYTDLVYNVFMGFLQEKWFCNVSKRDIAFKHSFRNIFNNFLQKKKQRFQRRQKISTKITKTLQSLTQLKQKMQQSKRQKLFLQEQNNIRLSELTQKIEKQHEKYTSQKKKIQQLREKFTKKQKQYQESLKSYRLAMDKYSFQYGKIKDRLIKILLQFQTNKLNINNALTPDNKIMVEMLSCVVGIVDFKKNQDISLLALRQFIKGLKQRGITKLIQKTSIQSIPSKVLPRLEKVMQQLQHIGHKNIELVVSTSKKIPQMSNQQQDENNLLKTHLYQYLQICLVSSRQFNNPHVKQFYDSIQNAGKLADKYRSELSKKQKNKALRQLFTSYDALVEQKCQLLTTKQQLLTTLQKIQQILQSSIKQITTNLPQLTQQSIYQSEIQQQKQSSAYIMSICVRYFNQLYSLTREELVRVFQYLRHHLEGIQMELQHCLDCFGSDWGMVDHVGVVDSVFVYRGFVLVQVDNMPYSPSQHDQHITNDLLYNNRRIRTLTLQQLLTTTKLQLTDCDGIKIRIDKNTRQQQTKQPQQFMDEVQKILNLQLPHEKLKQIKILPWEVLTQRYWQRPIFIQSPYFSHEQKSNYPYINFVQLPINKQGNNQNNDCVRLSYSYVYKKCRQILFGSEDNTLQYKDIVSQKKISSQIKNQHQNQLQKFMQVPLLPPEQERTLQNTIYYCQKLDSIFVHSITPEQMAVSSQPPSSRSNQKSVQEQKQDTTLTDKQKNKIFLQNKICQFFSKYYIICQSFASNNMGKPISLTYYLQNINKIVKNLSTSTSNPNPTPTNNPLSTIYQLLNNPQSTILRHLYKLKRQLLSYVPQVYNYLIMGLCNVRLQVFGNQAAYQRYVDIFVTQYANRSHHNKQTKNPTAQTSPKHPETTPEPNPKKQQIQQHLQKISTHVPHLQGSLCQQVTNDFEFWEEDVENMYKEQKQPPVQWYSLLLIHNSERFVSYVRSLEVRLVRKYSGSDQQQIYQLQILLAPPNKNNTVVYNPITPIFISTHNRYQQLTKYLLQHRQDYQFIDMGKLVSKYDPTKTQTPTQSQRSHNTSTQINISVKGSSGRNRCVDNREIQCLMDSSKVYITFVNDHREFAIFCAFVDMLYANIQNKSMKSNTDEISQIKIIILTPYNWHYSTINTSQPPPSSQLLKNSLTFKQKHTQKQQYLLRVYHTMGRFYHQNLKDKIKVKQYQLLSTRIKRTIYEVFVTVQHVVVSLGVCCSGSGSGCSIRDMIDRCADYVDKLVKLVKVNNKSTMNTNFSSTNTLFQCHSNWKSIINQIISQCIVCNNEQIVQIFNKSIQQSSAIVQQKQSTVPTTIQNRIHTIINQSQTHKKIRKMIILYNVNVNGNDNANTAQNRSTNKNDDNSEEQLCQLYGRVYREMVGLYQLPYCGEECTSAKSISYTNNNGCLLWNKQDNFIQIQSFMYLACRKYAILNSVPINQIKCMIKLEPSSQHNKTNKNKNKQQNNRSYTLENAVIRIPLSHKYQKHQYSYLIKITPGTTNTSKTKQTLTNQQQCMMITHPNNRILFVQICHRLGNKMQDQSYGNDNDNADGRSVIADYYYSM